MIATGSEESENLRFRKKSLFSARKKAPSFPRRKVEA